MNLKCHNINKFLCYFLFLLFSAVILFFTSQCSPFYVICSDVDNNIYMSIDKAIRSGSFMYRDIFDHKGPLWYGFYYIIQCITPGSFLGVYLFEIIFMWFYYYYVYKSVHLFCSDDTRCLFLTLLSCSLFMYSPTIGSGRTDEFFLPFAAYAVYILMESMHNDRDISYLRFFIVGLHMGVLFWTKFTSLFFYAGCFIYLIIFCRRKLFKGTLFVTSGMCLVSFFVLLYFFARGTVSDLFDVYFGANLFSYYSDVSFFEKLFINFSLLTYCVNIPYALLTIFIIFIIYIFDDNLLKTIVSKMKVCIKSHKKLYCLLFLLLFFSIVPVFLVGGRVFHNYYAQIGATLAIITSHIFYNVFFMSDFSGFLFFSRCKNSRVLKVSFACIFAICTLIAYHLNVYIQGDEGVNINLFHANDVDSDLRYRVADYIRNNNDSVSDCELIIYGMLDCGFEQMLDWQCMPEHTKYIVPTNARTEETAFDYFRGLCSREYDYIVANDWVKCTSVREVIHRDELFEVFGISDDMTISDFIESNDYEFLFDGNGAYGETYMFYELKKS